MTKNTHSNYPTFSDVENTMLKIYNIANTLQSINADLGGAEAEKYMEKLSPVIRTQVYVMLMAILERGHDSIVKEINNA